MKIDVAPLPSALLASIRDVCIVVDVLRATSVIGTLLARGASEVEVVAEVEEAHARRADGALICGERGGLPPPGFDYGNSPAEFSTLDLAGRRVVLCTSNGTKALLHVADAPAVFAGALLNSAAVVAAALRAARAGGHGLTVVCAGTNLGAAFSLEDFFCAGALVAAALIDAPDAELGDGAQAALHAYTGFDRDARAAFAAAQHGRALAVLGLAADLAFCAQTDLYDLAPRAQRRGGRLVLRAE